MVIKKGQTLCLSFLHLFLCSSVFRHRHLLVPREPKNAAVAPVLNSVAAASKAFRWVQKFFVPVGLALAFVVVGQAYCFDVAAVCSVLEGSSCFELVACQG